MIRLLLAVAAVFLLWEITDFILHGMVLGATYGSHPELFRPQADMKMSLLVCVVLAHAVVFTKIYAWLISPKSLLAGVIFGLLWGVGHGVGMGYGTFATMPIPANMASTWCLAAIVQGVLAGVAVGLIIRRRDEPAV